MRLSQETRKGTIDLNVHANQPYSSHTICLLFLILCVRLPCVLACRVSLSLPFSYPPTLLIHTKLAWKRHRRRCVRTTFLLEKKNLASDESVAKGMPQGNGNSPFSRSITDTNNTLWYYTREDGFERKNPSIHMQSWTASLFWCRCRSERKRPVSLSLSLFCFLLFMTSCSLRTVLLEDEQQCQESQSSILKKIDIFLLCRQVSSEEENRWEGQTFRTMSP